MALLNPTIAFPVGIVLVAIFLGLWQWFDRRARDAGVDEADRYFFRRQDREARGAASGSWFCLPSRSSSSIRQRQPLNSEDCTCARSNLASACHDRADSRSA